MDQYTANQTIASNPDTGANKTTATTKQNPTRSVITQPGRQTTATKAIIDALGQQPTRPATAKAKSSVTASIAVPKVQTVRPNTAPVQTRVTNIQAKKQNAPLSQKASALVTSLTQAKPLTNTGTATATATVRTADTAPQSSIISVIQNMKKNEGIEVLKQISEYYGIRITIHDNEETTDPPSRSAAPPADSNSTLKAVLTNVGNDRKRRADATEAEQTNPPESGFTARGLRPRMSVGAQPESRAGGFQRILHSHLPDMNQTY